MNRIDPAVMSPERRRTISLGKGWGHYLYSAKLARTTGKLNVAAMFEALSIPGRPTMEK